MEKRFCGIDLAAIADRLTGNKPEKRVAKTVLTEIIAGAAPFRAVHDDLMPARHYCLLLLGRHDKGFYFVKLEGPHAPGSEREMEIPLIRHAVDTLPANGSVDAAATAQRLLAAPQKTAVGLLIGETVAAGINYGFCRNPILGENIAGKFLSSYLRTYLAERTAQN